MRADIHDGPEQTLQSEAGYSNARPHQPRSTKTSCTARPDHTGGSFASIHDVPLHVRFTPDSDRIADIPDDSLVPNGELARPGQRAGELQDRALFWIDAHRPGRFARWGYNQCIAAKASTTGTLLTLMRPIDG